MRLFKKIRYIRHRLRRCWNHIVELVLLYDEGIICIIPKEETDQED